MGDEPVNLEQLEKMKRIREGMINEVFPYDEKGDDPSAYVEVGECMADGGQEEEIERRLTNDEARQLHDLLGRLDEEMDEQLEERTYNPEDVSYTTIIRRKRQQYLEQRYNVGGSDDSDLLEEIRGEDRRRINGGCYVRRERREEAEKLVGEGKVVRLQNPAGVGPMYVPMDSSNYSDERLEKLREKQMTDSENMDK